MTADPTAIAAARQVLAHLGVTVTDLQSHPATPAVLPTVAEYLPRVVAAAGPGARRTYGTYWDRMAAAWPERPLDFVTASDVEALKQAMITRLTAAEGRPAGARRVATVQARAWNSRDRILLRASRLLRVATPCCGQRGSLRVSPGLFGGELSGLPRGLLHPSAGCFG
ncbi:hypothetical protein [Micromonospora chokoriensis]|uniref:hypothetical protein n=1 Tax=Micromonospora chokoriensis TaxID=356851 RepID=UPI000B5ACD36|nr:hypothetical protein [Micromonospora chokoriensis]